MTINQDKYAGLVGPLRQGPPASAQHEQRPGGTAIWELPDGHTDVTILDSALLFPIPCGPTGDPPTPRAAPADGCGERTR